MPETVDRYGRVISEIASRSIRETKIQVIDYQPKSTTTLRLAAPGTVTIYLSKKGSGLLDEVRAAVTDSNRIEKLQTNMQKQLKRTKSSSLEDFAALMIRQPVLADIRYGGATLNRGVFLPKGCDLFPIPFAYIGGRLAKQGFTLAEYYKEGSDAALEAVAIRSTPTLTDAEKEAIRQIPDSQLGQSVTTLARWCDTTWWMVAAAVVAVAAVTVNYTCICARMEEVHLSDNELRKLGPAASAQKLIGLRRQALEQSFPE
jgi:hypothetical protein